MSKIGIDYFGSDAAKEIYTRISGLLTNGKSIPSTEVLKNDEVLNDASRAAISNPSIGSLYSDGDVDMALTMLSKYRKVRILYSTVTTAVEVLQQNDADVDSVVTNMERMLQQCHSGSSKNEMTHYSKASLEERSKEVNDDLNTPISDAIPSSFQDFDKKTGGFRKKNVITLASTSGGGKSAVMLQMASNQYMMGYNVCICSYEMDEIETRYRLLSSISKVKHTEINLKRLTKEKIDLINKRFEEFINSSPSNNRFTIWCPERELDIPEIGMELKPYGYDIIYVDYIGLLKQTPGRATHEVLGDHARAAKLQANALNAAIVLLAQYDDKEEKIKYSKAIVANSNFVWAWDNGQKEKESGIIEVKQLKARNADVYSFFLQRDFSTMTIKDMVGPPPIVDITPPKTVPSMPELR